MKSLNHFLDLTFLFLFLPQMNWVSTMRQVCGEAEGSRCSQRMRVMAFLVQWEGVSWYDFQDRRGI